MSVHHEPRHSRSLEAQLRAEEPPLNVEDTRPSLISRRVLGDQWLSVTPRSRWVRALALFLLASAAVLGVLAAYLWMDADTRGVTGTPVEAADRNMPPVGVPAQEQLTATPAPPTVAQAEPQQPPYQGISYARPTAAADEIAAALYEPPALEPAERAIVRQSAPFTTRSSAARSHVVQYTVQEGDTLQSIAEKFGLQDFYTLIWSNKSSKYNPLRPGVQLNILPEDGVYHEVTEPITIGELAEKYGVDPYAIIDAEYNDLFGSTPETLLPPGMWVVVPGGEAERELFLQRPTGGTGSTGTADYVSGTYNLWGCTADVQGGSLPYGRPLANYTWIRGYTPGGHTGVDLAANVGEPVMAAGAGTVVYAGWNDTGYGNVVVIAHGPVFTLYGHMSAINVRCGQQVSAGQVIGAVGNTGNSSGPHLHFEVRDANFNVLNPQNWVGF